MKLVKFLSFFLLAGSLLLFTRCNEDDPNPLTIIAMVANGTDLMTGQPIEVDLNGTTAATDVPLDAVITVTFDRTIDATTVNTTTITLTQGGSNVTIAVNGTGTRATITPSADFERGLDYTISLSGGILADDGGALAATSRVFTAAGRAGITPPNDADQLAYWALDGDATSSVGNYNGTEVGIAYETDRFGNVESAAYFDGDVSIIEFPNADNLMSTSMTWSFWVKMDTAGHVGGHFVMGLGDVAGFFVEIQGPLGGMKLNTRYTKSDGTTQGNDFFFNGDGKDANNGGWVGVEFETDLSGTGGLASMLGDKWAHIIFTYDGAANKRSLYINGQLMETDNLNNPPGTMLFNGTTFDPSALAGETVGNALAFGFNHDRASTHWNDQPWGGYSFPDANHFKGWMDDVRIFSAAFTLEDAQQLYNAEKP